MGFFPTSILLATDGSEEARMATQVAIDLSRATGSEVHVFSVLPAAGEPIGHHNYPADRRQSLLEGAERDARKLLDEQAERIRSEGGKVAETHTLGPRLRGAWRRSAPVGRSGGMGADSDGKAAIVTGGANGIGREIAPRLAGAGAAVLVADRDGAGALAGVIFEPEEAE